MAGGIATITNSHGPTPFRTCEGEARLGNGLPNLSAPARWANGAASWAVDKIVELEVV